MTETKFTPGPWRISEVWRPHIGLRREGSANPIGDVFYGYSISGSNEGGAHILPTLAAVHNFPDNIEANARLIAAALFIISTHATAETLRTAGEKRAVAVAKSTVLTAASLALPPIGLIWFIGELAAMEDDKPSPCGYHAVKPAPVKRQEFVVAEVSAP